VKCKPNFRGELQWRDFCELLPSHRAITAKLVPRTEVFLCPCLALCPSTRRVHAAVGWFAQAFSLEQKSMEKRPVGRYFLPYQQLTLRPDNWYYWLWSSFLDLTYRISPMK